MFRLWAKAYEGGRMVKDMVVEDPSSDSRTAKIFHAITKICHEMDLSEPLWLDSNIREFKRISKTRFGRDNFIDGIDFDFLEIHIIEEDF